MGSDQSTRLANSGVLKYLYEYDAYGNITADYNSGGGSAPTDDILLTGKDKDDVSGLYYFNARWYDPEVGSYISRTPLAPHVEGAYLFCEDNPVSYYDDNGLKPNKPRPEEPPGEPMPGVLETIGTGLSTISVFIPLPPVQIAGALGSGISGGLWIWRADQHLTCGLFTDWLGSFIYWAGVAQFTGESATSAYAGIAGPDFPPYDSKNPPPDWIHPLIGWIGGVIGGIHLGGGDCYPPSPGNPRGLPPWQLPKQ